MWKFHINTIKCSCNFYEIKKNDACFSEFVPIANTYWKITQIPSKENLSQMCQVMKVSNYIKVMCHYRSREWMMSLNTSNELFDKKIPKIQIISFAKLNDVTKFCLIKRIQFQRTKVKSLIFWKANSHSILQFINSFRIYWIL